MQLHAVCCLEVILGSLPSDRSIKQFTLWQMWEGRYFWWSINLFYLCNWSQYLRLPYTQVWEGERELKSVTLVHGYLGMNISRGHSDSYLCTGGIWGYGMIFQCWNPRRSYIGSWGLNSDSRLISGIWSLEANMFKHMEVREDRDKYKTSRTTLTSQSNSWHVQTKLEKNEEWTLAQYSQCS